MNRLDEVKSRLRAAGLNGHKQAPAALSLRGQQMDAKAVRLEENARSVGETRNPRISVNKIPGHKEWGSKVLALLSKQLMDHPDMQEGILSAHRGAERRQEGPQPG